MTDPRPTGVSILATSIALLALWALSWGVSSIELGAWSLLIALAIATAKAVLVAFIFMELIHVRASVRLIAASAVVMLGIMLALVMIDVVARGLAS
jgi:cytochrome c oxidase subunit 4